jgi:hypothetical protein
MVVGDEKFQIPTMRTGDRRIVSFQIRPDNFETTGKDVTIVLDLTFDGNTRPPMRIFKRFYFGSKNIQAKFQFPFKTRAINAVTVSVRNVGGGQIDLIAYNSTLGRQEEMKFLGLLRPGDNRSVVFMVRKEDIAKNRVTIGIKENGGFSRFVNRHLKIEGGKIIDVD